MGLIGASSANTIAAIDRAETDRARERKREASRAGPSHNDDRQDVVIIAIERPEAIEPADADHGPGDPRDHDRDAAAYTPTGERGLHAPASSLDLSV